MSWSVSSKISASESSREPLDQQVPKGNLENANPATRVYSKQEGKESDEWRDKKDHRVGNSGKRERDVLEGSWILIVHFFFSD